MDDHRFHDLLAESLDRVSRIGADLESLKSPKSLESLGRGESLRRWDRILESLEALKRTCRPIGLEDVGQAADPAEGVLGRMNEDPQVFTSRAVALLLETVERIRALLERLEATGELRPQDRAALLSHLDSVEQASSLAPGGDGVARGEELPNAAEGVRSVAADFDGTTDRERNALISPRPLAAGSRCWSSADDADGTRSVPATLGGAESSTLEQDLERVEYTVFQPLEGTRDDVVACPAERCGCEALAWVGMDVRLQGESQAGGTEISDDALPESERDDRPRLLPIPHATRQHCQSDQKQTRTRIDSGHSQCPPRRVLVIDDSLFFRQLAIAALDAAGYGVTSAESAVRAVAIIEAGELFDAIVCDIEMPEMDGCEFAEWLRSRPATKKTPLIALSALSESTDVARAMRAGFDRYVTKFTSRKLTEALEELLGGNPMGAGALRSEDSARRLNDDGNSGVRVGLARGASPGG